MVRVFGHAVSGEDHHRLLTACAQLRRRRLYQGDELHDSLGQGRGAARRRGHDLVRVRVWVWVRFRVRVSGQGQGHGEGQG